MTVPESIAADAPLAGDAVNHIVGVIGSGTMGAGIAQVAAASGHTVRLFDLRAGAAAGAIAQTAKALTGLVEKDACPPRNATPPSPA